MHFNSFKIKTDKDKFVQIDKLKKLVCTDKQPFFSFNLDFRGKQFFGTIDDDSFDIMPAINRRNSFVPVIKGKIIGDNQSIILIKMRLHYAVIAFIVWITLLVLLSMQNDFQYSSLIFLALLYSITIVFYLKESRKYKLKLEGYFK